MLRKAHVSSFFLGLVALASAVVGCAAPEEASGSASASVVAPQDHPVNLRFTAHGETTDVTSTASEVASVASRPLAGVTHQGKPAVDAAAVLSLDTFELRLNSGETIALVREGNGFRHDGDAKLSASWSADFRSVTYSGPSGVVTVDVSSILDEDVRAHVVGYLTLAGFGGAVTDPGTAEVAPLIPLVFAGAFVVSVAACLWGNHDCPQQARNACRPRGVRASKAICGAGVDVDGNMQFGLHCSFRCN